MVVGLVDRVVDVPSPRPILISNLVSFSLLSKQNLARNQKLNCQLIPEGVDSLRLSLDNLSFIVTSILAPGIQTKNKSAPIFLPHCPHQRARALEIATRELINR